MNSTWTRLVTYYRRQSPSTTAVLVIIIAVLLGNVMFLAGLGNDNPISWTSGISTVVCRVACFQRSQMIDPNVGYITQALGHRAAIDLVHFHLPWWNYFEGLGQPLVGEMQAAALFPLTLLFALPAGLLWFHICLEVIAGVSTYFLAKRLSMPVVIATGAGILFALNGTYSWVGNAVLNPIAFLPMLLLGIEMIFDSARGGSRKGWYVAALALAFSIYAGFPEVAYLDGLFCGGWAVVRFFSLPRASRLIARRLGLAGLVGGLLSLPVIIPFYDFMKVAFVGNHVASVDGSAHMSIHAAPMLIDPYVYGPIFFNPNVSFAWGGIGGYFGAAIIALALLGLFGTRLRPVRIFLAVWTFAGLLGAFNIAHFRVLWNFIPLIKTLSFGRYIMPSCEMALVLLAVLGIMDFATEPRAKRLFYATTLVGLVAVTWAALEARSFNRGVPLNTKERIIFMGLDAIPFLAIFFLFVFGRFSRAKVAPVMLTLIVVGESLLMFFVPTAVAPKKVIVDQAPISFLLKNQGQERFLDFGVLTPNWGSQYGLNELSAIDLPLPKAFTTFIGTQLYPGLTPVNQFTVKGGIVGIEAQEQAVADHFSTYQNASVKYLLFLSAVPLLPALAKLGVTQVFSDGTATIYEMPSPRPFFSTTSTSCTVTSASVDAATVNCPNGAATLIRTELSMAGWKAAVNGRAITIQTSEGVYQSIPVPKGTSAVTFSFVPPHEKYGVLAGLLAALFLVGSWIRDRRRAKTPPQD